MFWSLDGLSAEIINLLSSAAGLCVGCELCRSGKVRKVGLSGECMMRGCAILAVV